MTATDASHMVLIMPFSWEGEWQWDAAVAQPATLTIHWKGMVPG